MLEAFTEIFLTGTNKIISIQVLHGNTRRCLLRQSVSRLKRQGIWVEVNKKYPEIFVNEPSIVKKTGNQVWANKPTE